MEKKNKKKMVANWCTHCECFPNDLPLYRVKKCHWCGEEYKPRVPKVWKTKTWDVKTGEVEYDREPIYNSNV